MPLFPLNAPPVGQELIITLANSTELTAEWDGLQWWAPLNNDPNPAPIVNEFVVAWRNH